METHQDKVRKNCELQSFTSDSINLIPCNSLMEQQLSDTVDLISCDILLEEDSDLKLWESTIDLVPDIEKDNILKFSEENKCDQMLTDDEAPTLSCTLKEEVECITISDDSMDAPQEKIHAVVKNDEEHYKPIDVEPIKMVGIDLKKEKIQCDSETDVNKNETPSESTNIYEQIFQTLIRKEVLKCKEYLGPIIEELVTEKVQNVHGALNFETVRAPEVTEETQKQCKRKQKSNKLSRDAKRKVSNKEPESDGELHHGNRRFKKKPVKITSNRKICDMIGIDLNSEPRERTVVLKTPNNHINILPNEQDTCDVQDNQSTTNNSLRLKFKKQTFVNNTLSSDFSEWIVKKEADPSSEFDNSECDANVNNFKHNESSSKETFVCDVCEFYDTTSVTSFRSHQLLHRELHLKCNNCDKMFFRKNDLKAHISTHMQNFQCLVCEKVYKSKHHLLYHVKSHYNKKGKCKSSKTTTYNCSYCHKSYSSKSNVKRHRLNVHE